MNTTDSQLKILDAVRLVPDDKATTTGLMAVSGLARTTFYRALNDLTDAGQLIPEKTGNTRRYRLPHDTLDIDGDTDQ